MCVSQIVAVPAHGGAAHGLSEDMLLWGSDPTCVLQPHDVLVFCNKYNRIVHILLDRVTQAPVTDE